MENNKSGMSILFVCYGNVCRSPMAEFMFNDLVAKDPLLREAGISGSSVGIRKNNGLSASDQTIMVMRERGLGNIMRHKGREIEAQLLREADLILTMEHQDKADLLARFPESVDRTFLLAEYAGGSGEIEDPAGRSTEMYRLTASKIEGYLKTILASLKERLQG